LLNKVHNDRIILIKYFIYAYCESEGEVQGIIQHKLINIKSNYSTQIKDEAFEEASIAFVHSYLLDKGQCNIKAKCGKKIFAFGEEAKLQIDIDNSKCSLAVKRLRVSYIQKVKFTSERKVSFPFENVLVEKTLELNCKPETITSVPCELQLPFGTGNKAENSFGHQPSLSLQSDLIRCEYHIQVEAEFDSYISYPSPAVDLPVVLCNDICLVEKKKMKIKSQESISNDGCEETHHSLSNDDSLNHSNFSQEDEKVFGEEPKVVN